MHNLATVPFSNIGFRYMNTELINRKTVKILCLGLFLVISTLSKAQNTLQNLDVQAHNPVDIIPPAPSVAGYTKYIDIPVSEYTGVPSINIPIYTISTSGFELPISLSYHASGNKVNEEASWVGLGWVLNSGGLITRKVLDLPDDLSSFVASYPSSQTEAFQWIGSSNEEYYDIACQKVVQHNNAGYLFNGFDESSDIYYLSIGNISVQFIYDKTTQRFITSESECISISIEQDITSGKINSFIIEDEAGVEYVFSDREVTEQFLPHTQSWNLYDTPNLQNYDFQFLPWTNSSYTKYRCRNSLNINDDNQLNKKYTSSWYISRIVLPNAKQITFDYTTEEHTIIDMPSIYTDKNDLYKEKPFDSPDKIEGVDYFHVSVGKRIVTAKRIQSINWDEGYGYSGSMEFIINSLAREDFKHISQTSGKLNSIRVTKGNLLEKKVDLFHSYIRSGGYETVSADKKPYYSRLQLNSIQILGKTASKDHQYSFKYFNSINQGDYNSTVYTDMPHKRSFDMDAWGYYNGANNSTLIPSYYIFDNSCTAPFPLPSNTSKSFNLNNLLNYTFLDISGFQLSCTPRKVLEISNSGYSSSIGRFRLADRNATTRWESKLTSMVEFTNPHGGRTNIEYETNQFELQGFVFNGGGIRVKSRIDNSINKVEKALYYNYNRVSTSGYIPNSSSGLLASIPCFIRMGDYTSFPVSIPYERVTVSSTPVNELQSTNGGSVGYTSVGTHYDSPNSYERVIRTFSMPLYVGLKYDYLQSDGNIFKHMAYGLAEPNPFNYPDVIMDFVRGKMLSETYYDKEDFKIRNINYHYFIKAFNRHTLKYGRNSGYTEGSFDPPHAFNFYRGWVQVKKNVVSEFNRSNSLMAQTTTHYNYLNPNLAINGFDSPIISPVRTSKNTLEGDSIVSQIFYTNSFIKVNTNQGIPPLSSTLLVVGIQRALDANMLNIPIEETLYLKRKGLTSMEVISSRLSIMSNTENPYLKLSFSLPKKGFIEGVNFVGLYSKENISDFAYNQFYNLEYDVLEYSNASNGPKLIYSHKDGLYHSYSWSGELLTAVSQAPIESALSFQNFDRPFVPPFNVSQDAFSGSYAGIGNTSFSMSIDKSGSYKVELWAKKNPGSVSNPTVSITIGGVTKSVDINSFDWKKYSFNINLSNASNQLQIWFTGSFVYDEFLIAPSNTIVNKIIYDEFGNIIKLADTNDIGSVFVLDHMGRLKYTLDRNRNVKSIVNYNYKIK